MKVLITLLGFLCVVAGLFFLMFFRHRDVGNRVNPAPAAPTEIAVSALESNRMLYSKVYEAKARRETNRWIFVFSFQLPNTDGNSSWLHKLASSLEKRTYDLTAVVFVSDDGSVECVPVP